MKEINHFQIFNTYPRNVTWPRNNYSNNQYFEGAPKWTIYRGPNISRLYCIQVLLISLFFSILWMLWICNYRLITIFHNNFKQWILNIIGNLSREILPIFLIINLICPQLFSIVWVWIRRFSGLVKFFEWFTESRLKPSDLSFW